MNFKERSNPNTTVNVIKTLVPRVGIASEALTKMAVYVDECNDEIGWLGTAYKNEEQNTILIQDVYLFDQDVHGATTEITPEGLSDFAEELLSMGETGIEIWNNLKMWGHSHVRMGVTPSGQDNSQMETFKQSGHDWFIRLIANKNGEMKIDLYDYKLGISYLDLPWVEVISDRERAIQEQIDALYAQLDQFEAERLEAYKAPIQEEMKAKVRKMNFSGNKITASGYWQGGKWVSTSKEDEKKTATTNIGHGTKTSITTGGTEREYYGFDDALESVEDVKEYFTNWELLELAECTSYKELETELTIYGYQNFFSANDLEKIWKAMRQVQKQYGRAFQ